MSNRWDMSGFSKFQKLLDKGLRQRSGPMHDMLKQWGLRYLTFARRRYVRYSRGGGDWPDLKASTKRSRRKGRKGRKGSRRFAILRDLGVLLNALTITMPGNLYLRRKNGIRVGFGGASRHPGGKKTIRDIAVAHDQGQGRLPKRQIIVDPNRQTMAGMKADLQRAVSKIGKQSEI